MISIIAGTNRPDAVTLQIATLYQQLLHEQQAPTQLINLAHLPHDFAFSALYHKSGKNEEFNQFSKQIAQSSKYVFVIPEYNGSFPGVLKTFIDGLPYPNPMQHKTAALVGLASGVQGGALALSHFNDILSYLNVDVLGLRLKLSAIGKHLADGKITNPVYNDLMRQQIAKLLA